MFTTSARPQAVSRASARMTSSSSPTPSPPMTRSARSAAVGACRSTTPAMNVPWPACASSSRSRSASSTSATSSRCSRNHAVSSYQGCGDRPVSRIATVTSRRAPAATGAGSGAAGRGRSAGPLHHIGWPWTRWFGDTLSVRWRPPPDNWADSSHTSTFADGRSRSRVAPASSSRASHQRRTRSCAASASRPETRTWSRRTSARRPGTGSTITASRCRASNRTSRASWSSIAFPPCPRNRHSSCRKGDRK
ncbi:hypothetical protein amrb99_62180 [Actinomadura sp. RB99]|nr:hypothetical protein [Actinomadura sp. RB99]